eukprot:GDKJ01031172.1.p1 GENE.GDKJ01031172.1~~GDKJ01031172.1.p1  ORF type:complete len:1155 (-),score=359.96 GDKJ01031172.1:466-3930(-)
MGTSNHLVAMSLRASLAEVPTLAHKNSYSMDLQQGTNDALVESGLANIFFVDGNLFSHVDKKPLDLPKNFKNAFPLKEKSKTLSGLAYRRLISQMRLLDFFSMSRVQYRLPEASEKFIKSLTQNYQAILTSITSTDVKEGDAAQMKFLNEQVMDDEATTHVAHFLQHAIILHSFLLNDNFQAPKTFADEYKIHSMPVHARILELFFPDVSAERLQKIFCLEEEIEKTFKVVEALVDGLKPTAFEKDNQAANFSEIWLTSRFAVWSEFLKSASVIENGRFGLNFPNMLLAERLTPLMRFKYPYFMDPLQVQSVKVSKEVNDFNFELSSDSEWYMSARFSDFVAHKSTPLFSHSANDKRSIRLFGTVLPLTFAEHFTCDVLAPPSEAGAKTLTVNDRRKKMMGEYASLLQLQSVEECVKLIDSFVSPLLGQRSSTDVHTARSLYATSALILDHDTSFHGPSQLIDVIKILNSRVANSSLGVMCKEVYLKKGKESYSSLVEDITNTASAGSGESEIEIALSSFHGKEDNIRALSNAHEIFSIIQALGSNPKTSSDLNVLPRLEEFLLKQNIPEATSSLAQVESFFSQNSLLTNFRSHLTESLQSTFEALSTEAANTPEWRKKISDLHAWVDLMNFHVIAHKDSSGRRIPSFLPDSSPSFLSRSSFDPSNESQFEAMKIYLAGVTSDFARLFILKHSLDARVKINDNHLPPAPPASVSDWVEMTPLLHSDISISFSKHERLMTDVIPYLVACASASDEYSWNLLPSFIRNGHKVEGTTGCGQARIVGKAIKDKILTPMMIQGVKMDSKVFNDNVSDFVLPLSTDLNKMVNEKLLKTQKFIKVLDLVTKPGSPFVTLQKALSVKLDSSDSVMDVTQIRDIVSSSFKDPKFAELEQTYSALIKKFKLLAAINAQSGSELKDERELLSFVLLLVYREAFVLKRFLPVLNLDDISKNIDSLQEQSSVAPFLRFLDVLIDGKYASPNYFTPRPHAMLEMLEFPQFEPVVPQLPLLSMISSSSELDFNAWQVFETSKTSSRLDDVLSIVEYLQCTVNRGVLAALTKNDDGKCTLPKLTFSPEGGLDVARVDVSALKKKALDEYLNVEPEKKDDKKPSKLNGLEIAVIAIAVALTLWFAGSLTYKYLFKKRKQDQLLLVVDGKKY